MPSLAPSQAEAMQTLPLLSTRHTPHDDHLEEAGFDDQAILQITLIASWFNYINRVADALGVGRR